jgi:two-component system cell cycle response regulator
MLRSQIIAGLRMVTTHRELMRTNDILSAIALSDPLTELNNRRALDWELPRQVQNARSRSEDLSVLMLDVDHFKTVNDTYGHQVGDRALQLIASRLRHNLRFRDTLFRYGGEEFVIILGCTEKQESLLVAHRLCRLIGDQPFTIDETLDLTITISAGVASLQPRDDPRGISLLKRADSNLLRAKSTGRNRVVSCQDSTAQTLSESNLITVLDDHAIWNDSVLQHNHNSTTDVEA